MPAAPASPSAPASAPPAAAEGTPLTITLPPNVLAALRGRAAARDRTPEEEAAAAIAASVDILLPKPPPQIDPDDDWRNDPEWVAWVERVRATAPPLPDPPEPGLAEYLANNPGVETGLTDEESFAFWKTIRSDGAGSEDAREGGETRPVTREAA